MSVSRKLKAPFTKHTKQFSLLSQPQPNQSSRFLINDQNFSLNNKIINVSQSIINSVQSSPKPSKHKDKNTYNIQIFYKRHRSSSVGESIEIKPNRKSHNVSKGITFIIL